MGPLRQRADRPRRRRDHPAARRREPRARAPGLRRPRRRHGDRGTGAAHLLGGRHDRARLGRDAHARRLRRRGGPARRVPRARGDGALAAHPPGHPARPDAGGREPRRPVHRRLAVRHVLLHLAVPAARARLLAAEDGLRLPAAGGDDLPVGRRGERARPAARRAHGAGHRPGLRHGRPAALRARRRGRLVPRRRARAVGDGGGRARLLVRLADAGRHQRRARQRGGPGERADQHVSAGRRRARPGRAVDAGDDAHPGRRGDRRDRAGGARRGLPARLPRRGRDRVRRRADRALRHPGPAGPGGRGGPRGGVASEGVSADGRYAPSPTGTLHLGNLRTALLAWLFARSAGARFLVRIEDLDRGRSRAELERGQLDDLAALGIDWDGEVVRQSERGELYAEAIARLDADGLLYPCFCTRAEIREAASAPHGPLPEGAYPGTCRRLTAAQREEREAAGRPPALRLDAQAAPIAFTDRVLGSHEGVVDDLVVRRNDGAPAYNLAVVVDDAAQGVGEVVRGADLLETTPRQLLLARLLGLPAPSYAHVPLVLGADGARLAKRHGAVTLDDRRALGESPGEVRAGLLQSVGLPGELDEALAAFDPALLPTEPTVMAAA